MDSKAINELADIVLAWVRAHQRASAGIAAGVVVVLIAIVFVATLAGSIQHLRTDGKQLSDEYQQFKEYVLSGDGENASEKAEAIRTLAEAIDRETDRWVWSVASVFPSAGGDVSKVRTLADTNLRLANEAAVPFAQAYAQFAETGILTEDGTIDPLALAANPGAPEQLLANLKELRPVISECNQQVKELGKANNEDLQHLIDTATETLGLLDASFTALDTVLTTTGGIGDTITSLLP